MMNIKFENLEEIRIRLEQVLLNEQNIKDVTVELCDFMPLYDESLKNVIAPIAIDVNYYEIDGKEKFQNQLYLYPHDVVPSQNYLSGISQKGKERIIKLLALT